jgi:hypothetical protein
MISDICLTNGRGRNGKIARFFQTMTSLSRLVLFGISPESVSNKAHFYQSRDRKGAVFRAATERGERFFAVLSPAPLRSRL